MTQSFSTLDWNLVYKLADLLWRSRCTSVCRLVAVLNRSIGHPIFTDYTGEVADFVNNEVWTVLVERNGTTFEARDSTGPAVEAVLDPSQAYIKGSSMF